MFSKYEVSTDKRVSMWLMKSPSSFGRKSSPAADLLLKLSWSFRSLTSYVSLVDICFTEAVKPGFRVCEGNHEGIFMSIVFGNS